MAASSPSEIEPFSSKARGTKRGRVVLVGLVRIAKVVKVLRENNAITFINIFKQSP